MTSYAHIVPARAASDVPCMISWRDPVDAGLSADTEDRWYLRIDEDGEVDLFVRTCRTSDATPEAEYHRRTFTYRIPGDVIDEKRLRVDLAEGRRLARLIDRVIAGHEIRRSGDSDRGYLTDDAQDASDDLQHALEDYEDSNWATWGAYDHLRTGLTAEDVMTEYDFGLDATDEQIEAAAERVKQSALNSGVLLGDDVEDALRNCIQDRREELEEEDAA